MAREQKDFVTNSALQSIMPLAIWAAEISDAKKFEKIIITHTELIQGNPLAHHAAVIYARSLSYLLTHFNEPDKCQRAFDQAKQLSKYKPTHDGHNLTAWLEEAEKFAVTALRTGDDATVLSKWDVREDQDELKNVFQLAFYFLCRVGKGMNYQQALRLCIK
jgi:ADP-ribosyl-[dinitrogen reductase] hydrolase